jgi:hypothetical protein
VSDRGIDELAFTWIDVPDPGVDEILGRDVPTPGPIRGLTGAPEWYADPVSAEVDITLIKETLALTPQQRIRQNDRVLRMIEELRDGLAKSGNTARDPRVE